MRRTIIGVAGKVPKKPHLQALKRAHIRRLSDTTEVVPFPNLALAKPCPSQTCAKQYGKARLFLIRGGRRRGRGRFVASLDPLVALALHLVPLLLLIRIQHSAYLIVGCLVGVHHFRATILL